MKTLTVKVLHVIFMVVLIESIILSSYSCSRCKDIEYPPKYLTPEDLSVVPYKNGDNLVLRGPQNDSMVLLDCFRELDDFTYFWGDDCNGNRFPTQTDWCEFHGVHNRVQFRLQYDYDTDLRPSYDLFHKTFSLSLGFNVDTTYLGYFYNSVLFEKDSLYQGQYVQFLD